MTFLFPQWPSEYDTMPFLQNEVTTISSLWINYAQTLVETLEAEVGVAFTGLTLSLTELLDPLIVNSAGYPTRQNKWAGTSLITHTALGSTWGSKSYQVSFISAGSQYEAPILSNACAFAEPINLAQAIPYGFHLDMQPSGRIMAFTPNETVWNVMGWGAYKVANPSNHPTYDNSMSGSTFYTFRLLKLSMPVTSY